TALFPVWCTNSVAYESGRFAGRSNTGTRDRRRAEPTQAPLTKPSHAAVRVSRIHLRGFPLVSVVTWDIDAAPLSVRVAQVTEGQRNGRSSTARRSPMLPSGI